MFEILMVGLGGCIGAIMRFWVTNFVHRTFGIAWPIGTFTVNILGCFFVGWMAQKAETQQWLTFELRLLAVTGFLGAFTTFSAFGYETVVLFQQSRSLSALIDIGLHLLVGFAAVWFGQVVAGRA